MGKIILVGTLYGLGTYLLLFCIGLLLTRIKLIHKLPVVWEDVNAITVLKALIVAPLVEEAIFRYLPITVIFLRTSDTKIIWAVVIFCSVLFGRTHGSTYCILLQGVGGLVLSAAFLQEGYFAAVIAHSLVNVINIVMPCALKIPSFQRCPHGGHFNPFNTQTPPSPQ